MTKASHGGVACGHPQTAAAAAEMLAEGGNAFDAILAAFCAATVVEPVFCSLGGGGFLLAKPANQEALLYDFFVQTPRHKRPSAAIDFYPILADFGTTTQEFQIGLGACATPGAIKGLFAVHQEQANLPMARIVEPAVRFARDGFALREMDRIVFGVVGPILRATEVSRSIYLDGQDDFPAAGSRFCQPALAASLEALGREGEGLFYQGELGSRLVRQSQDQGGHLTQDDLDHYEVARRPPLQRRYRDATILTNPPPSSGGILIAFALALLSELDLTRDAFGSETYLRHLTKVMQATDQARLESELFRILERGATQEATDRLLDSALIAAYAQQVLGQPKASRGTTHMSVIDAAGNAAALTLSNGEGCGVVLDDSGIMLNNMLGEEDLNPGGFHRWPEDRRISSMMAPSLAAFDDGSIVALGSGGSNRIRTAILQVLIDLIDYRRGVEEAVNAPRLHVERGLANAETGFAGDVRRCLSDLAEKVVVWDEKNLFFGGVHAVVRQAGGQLSATGDPRRGGVGLVR